MTPVPPGDFIGPLEDDSYDLEFEIPFGYIGFYSYQFEIISHSSVKIYFTDLTTGEILKTHNTNSGIKVDNLSLGEGKYKLEIIPSVSTSNLTYDFTQNIEYISINKEYISPKDDNADGALNWEATVGGEPFENLIGKGDLVDWITFISPKNGRSAFKYTTDGDRVSFELYDSSMNLVTTFGTTGSGNKAISVELNKRYYVKVTLNGTMATYTLAITS